MLSIEGLDADAAGVVIGGASPEVLLDGTTGWWMGLFFGAFIAGQFAILM